MEKIVEIIKKGGIAVLPTDTIFGIVCQALNKKSVEKVYKLKKRNPEKPVIILISKIKDVEIFGTKIQPEEMKILKKYWPGKVSVILPCKDKKFAYLHRGTNSLAFRLPKKESLISLLKKTGPLIAPSSNPEGLSPAKNIKEAKEYFGDGVDFYLPGRTSKKASKVIKVEGGEITEIRK